MRKFTILTVFIIVLSIITTGVYAQTTKKTDNKFISGTITAVSSDSPEVTVKNSKGVETKLMGTKEQLTNLKTGENVRVTYTEEKDMNKIVKISVNTVNNETKKGSSKSDTPKTKK